MFSFLNIFKMLRRITNFYRCYFADETQVSEQETETQEEEENLEEEPEKEVVLIGDQEVEWNSVVKAYQDMQANQNWQAANTHKAEEIAAERQRLEADKQHIEQLRRDTELLLQRSQYQPPQKEQLATDQYYGLAQEDYEDLDPVNKMILKNQYEQSQAFKKLQEENEQREYYRQTQEIHGKLKSLYSDYNDQEIERAIIQGRNQFEDVYCAEAYKKLKSGDSNAIKAMIPQNVMEEIKKEVRNQVIEETRKKEKMKEKLSTVSPDKPGLAKLPSPPAKTYNDVQENVLRRIREQGISLTT